MRIKQVITLVVLACSFIISSQAQVKNEIEKTIVRVKSGNKWSTGFFWKQGDFVITNLHAMSNNEAEIMLPKNETWYNAKVIKVHKNADLVLLKVEDYQSPYYIKENVNKHPLLDESVFTIGYYGGNEKYQDKNFTIGLIQGGNNLKNLLPKALEDEIKNIGTPALNSEVFHLQGSLVRGFSGAPIVNYDGKLIGIADGGLENGATDVSWCISSKYLSELLYSTEQLPFYNSENSKLLLTSKSVSSTTIISANGYEFLKLKTRTFEELNQTADYSTYPELGIYQIMMVFELLGINYSQFKYDVYVEQITGATVVVPHGMILKEQGGVFIAESENSQNQIVIEVRKTHDIQYQTLLFEEQIKRRTNIFTWQLDPDLSFIEPFVRPDGVVINRKTFFNEYPSSYLFEVLAAKGNTFLGMYSFLENNNQFEFSIPDDVAQNCLAMHLTTFSY